MSRQNLPLPSTICQNHPTPYRNSEKCIKSDRTIQKQRKLSQTGNNNLEESITIKQHVNQGRTRKIDPNVAPEPTIAV